MKLTLEQQRNLNKIGYILLAGIFLGIVYVMFSDGFSSLYPYINALLVAPAMVLIIAFYEFVVFTGQVRKKGFRVLMVLRILAYTISVVIVVLGVLILTRMIKYDKNFSQIVASEEFRNFLRYGDFKAMISYVFGLVVLINFILQMDRKMGQGVLPGLILGRYRHAKEVQRFIMFLRLQNIDQLIQNLGNEKTLDFINEVLFDITDAIIFHGGVISEYVDGEMVILWTKSEGQKNANCLRAFFEIKEIIRREKINYYEKFNAAPEYIAALHFGTLVRGEVGIVKTEIVYSGDAMNTTSRQLKYAAKSTDLIASAEAMKLLDLPTILSVKKLGSVPMRGKQEEVEIMVIHEKVP
ncbi:MAG: adenylate/guanylate cyclase domain-containing protein [Saprospiraceae bacterium]|nr:adenylate/guanylate cyclase domain-containing protein [Saprospiraceae bacterium]